MWQMLVVLPLAIFLLSGVLLLYALRGRRVNDHPICRRCGFDLYGKPEGVTVCSECGTDLRRKGAVRVGRRIRRRRILFTSLPLLLLSAGWLGLLGSGATRGVNRSRHKPVWLLMREARGTDTPRRDAALVELSSRLNRGRLADAALTPLVDRGLDLQGNHEKPWVREWGLLIESAQQQGRLPPEKWQRYARQAVPLRIEARPRVRRGDRLPLRIIQGPSRTWHGLTFYVSGRRTELRVGGITVHQNQFGESALPSEGHTIEPLYDLSGVLPHLKNGRQTAEYVFDLEYRPFGSYDPSRRIRHRIEAETTWTLVPADGQTVGVVPEDAELAAKVRASLSASTASTQPFGAPLIIAAARPPVPLAFTVLARSPEGDELSLGSFVCAAGEHERQLLLTPPLGSLILRPKPLYRDVVLRPEVRAAAETLDLKEMWGGEVILEDVYRTAPAHLE